MIWPRLELDQHDRCMAANSLRVTVGWKGVATDMTSASAKRAHHKGWSKVTRRELDKAKSMKKIQANKTPRCFGSRRPACPRSPEKQSADGPSAQFSRTPLRIKAPKTRSSLTPPAGGSTHAPDQRFAPIGASAPVFRPRPGFCGFGPGCADNPVVVRNEAYRETSPPERATGFKALRHLRHIERPQGNCRIRKEGAGTPRINARPMREIRGR